MIDEARQLVRHELPVQKHIGNQVAAFGNEGPIPRYLQRQRPKVLKPPHHSVCVEKTGKKLTLT